MSTSPKIVGLPAELMELIITETWALSMSSKERATFITSSLLVNKTWMREFMRISSKDVHILSPKHVAQFFRLLDKRSVLFTIDPTLKDYSRRLVRGSLNMRLGEANNPKARTEVYPMRAALDRVVGKLSRQYFPFIRALNISFHDQPFSDFQAIGRLPPCFTVLNVSYTFSTELSRLLEVVSVGSHPPLFLKFSNVERLSVLGAPRKTVMDYVSASPQLQHLTTDCKLESWSLWNLEGMF
ncbi:hypothetical protein C8J56DRAFT_1055004 [Mycena floridula]|nr:hypothetical protein C8J56DRAFT_1055004 [Mycena floridula]